MVRKSYIENFSRNLLIHSMSTDFENAVNEWIYAGGDRSPRSRFSEQLLKTDSELRFPGHSENCICGHRIDENCYILNKQTKEILVSGNCCVNKFLPEDNRSKNLHQMWFTA